MVSTHRLASSGSKQLCPAWILSSGGGRLAFAHNVSRNYVMTQWENDWALWGGYLSWARACQAMHHFTRWDEQLAAGQTLEPGPPALKLVYEVLKGLP